MFTTAELKKLQRRKQALVAQSELRRCTLEVECAQLALAVGWVDRGFRLARSLSPWLKLAAPLAGYFLVRKRSRLLEFCVKGWSGWRLLRRVWPVARAIFHGEE